MGWTEYHANYYKNGKVDRKAECDNLWSKDCKVLKSTMKGSVYYGALQIPDGSVIGTVVITSGINRRNPYFNFGYKAMEETCGPCYYDCPKSILDLLTPTDSQWANEWREKCRRQLETKKTSWLKDVPIGGKVVWTRWDGTEMVLTKHAPACQFKTWFWLNESKWNYVKKKFVTEENTRPYQEGQETEAS